MKKPPRRAAHLTFIICSLIISASMLKAQPSGGPYGPVQKFYKVPSEAQKVFYAAPDGSENASGASVKEPTTIENAISLARSGDAIILRGGTYRTGDLLLNQGITIQPYENELPILKGTKIAENWTPIRGGLWVTEWKELFPSAPSGWWRRHREMMRTPLHKFNDDMVFIDGRMLQSAGWPGEVDENSFFIDYENQEVYIGSDPTGKTVEITAFNVAIHRVTGEVHGKSSDGKGPVIRGITFTQYAYRAFEIDGKNPEGISPETEHGKDVIGTTLEDCEITYCSRVAGYFRGDSLTIRNCRISHTSTEGLFVLSSNDVLLERNIISWNNIENITGYYPAAVKIFNQCYRVTCNDNLVIDHPKSNGIWYDVGNVDGVFTNNRLENIGVNYDDPHPSDHLWPSENAFFFEISKGALVAGNVFVNCDHGIAILNSSDVLVYNNTFVNSTMSVGRDSRSAEGDHFGWHPATGPGVEERDGHEFVNNLMVGDKDFIRPLLFVWQPPSICERVPEPPFSKLDNNMYVRTGNKSAQALIFWSPAANDKCQVKYDSPEGLHGLYTDYESGSVLLTNYRGPVFKSFELGDYSLLEGFPSEKVATIPPEPIQMLLDTQAEAYIGAYPLR